MDFKFCLLAGGRPGYLLAQIANTAVRMRDDDVTA